MTDGRGTIAIPADATFTIDPGAKLLRHELYIDEFQKYNDEQRSRHGRQR
jgi:hypothetical protein